MTIASSNIIKTELDMEIIVSEDDTTVYVKLTGFEDIADADKYAEFLTNNLPLLLFESEVMH
jgi:hypothetical protein